MRNEFCLVKGRKVDDTECGSIIFNATDAVIAVCRTCARGKALAGTTSIVVKQPAEPAAIAADVNSHAGKIEPIAPAKPANTAWELIVERTGCTSQEKLAKKIGGTYQSKISQIMVKLGKGIVPSGREWNRLLEITGLMPEELLLAAGCPLRASAPAESSPPFRDPATSLPSTPSGSDPSAEPDGTISHQPPTELEGEGATTLPAPEDCECNEGHGPCGACYSCRPDMYVLINGKSVLRADLPPLSQHLLHVAQQAAEVEDIPAIPTDIVFYDDQGPDSTQSTHLRFDKHGNITISPAAVTAFGLDKAERVRIGWSAATRQFFLQPGYTGSGSRKVQIGKKGCRARCVNTRLAVHTLGINPAPGVYPLTLAPTGLIVATITQQPSQGGEA